MTMNISRRTLFRRAAAVVPALILPELILPRRKVFAVGWAPKPGSWVVIADEEEDGRRIIVEYCNEHWNTQWLPNGSRDLIFSSSPSRLKPGQTLTILE